MVLAQLFEKYIILKYSAEPMGATTYLKTLYFPTTCTILHDFICGLGLNDSFALAIILQNNAVNLLKN